MIKADSLTPKLPLMPVGPSSSQPPILPDEPMRMRVWNHWGLDTMVKSMEHTKLVKVSQASLEVINLKLVVKGMSQPDHNHVYLCNHTCKKGWRLRAVVQ